MSASINLCAWRKYMRPFMRPAYIRISLVRIDKPQPIMNKKVICFSRTVHRLIHARVDSWVENLEYKQTYASRAYPARKIRTPSESRA